MAGDSVAFIKRVNLIKLCIGICIRTNICPKTILGFNAYQMIFPTLYLVGSGFIVLLGYSVAELILHSNQIADLVEFV